MTAYIFIAGLALTATVSVDACFPSKYWISCLIDTCKLGGKCPGDPTAECRMEKTECDGCKPVWYTPTGQIANCGLNRNLSLCPGGEPVVHCMVDSCKWPCSHPDFKSAPCRQSYCGQCAAEYFIKDTWLTCPVSAPGTAVERLPTDAVVGDSCVKVPCTIDICVGQRCPAAPGAVCRPDGCNECKAAWFVDNLPVNCLTGEFLTPRPIVSQPNVPTQRTCATNVPLTPCDMKVCDQKICRNFPNAVCRPDGCGGCKDTWYVDNKLVDCLSDECPPKVPIVKCVDDPCKYFGHYCPAAECRASQCGKCEAKFFANGTEIDCAMPPKECPAGVTPRTCPWYTCPADICPSDRRLMCRIDPCGSRCTYEFIDIYNGEALRCRVFDGAQRQRVPTPQPNIPNVNTVQPPALSDLVPSGVPQQSGIAIPGVVNAPGQGNPVGQTDVVPQGTQTNTGSSPNLNMQPLPASIPITPPDILTVLRSFPHEVAIIPSASIQTAIKNTVPLDPSPVNDPPTSVTGTGPSQPNSGVGSVGVAIPAGRPTNIDAPILGNQQTNMAGSGGNPVPINPPTSVNTQVNVGTSGVRPPQGSSSVSGNMQQNIVSQSGTPVQNNPPTSWNRQTNTNVGIPAGRPVNADAPILWNTQTNTGTRSSSQWNPNQGSQRRFSRWTGGD